MTIPTGGTLTLNNSSGDPVIRLVHLGDNIVRTERQYRNIMTGETSDWQPSKELGETETKLLTPAQIAHWLTQSED